MGTLHKFADKGGENVPAAWLDENFTEVDVRGSVGLDYSANKPSLPLLGADFGSSGPYANYVLATTIPANVNRASVEIQNLTGEQICVVLDDGEANTGQALVSASVFSLQAGPGPAGQGSGWSEYTFWGRVQVFVPAALTGSQYVYAHEN